MALQAPSAIAGVVGCGAGFADQDAPVKSLAFPYFGTVGERDMNYYEMRALDEKLAKAKAAYASASSRAATSGRRRPSPARRSSSSRSAP
jgi:hypothetical protein